MLLNVGYRVTVNKESVVAFVERYGKFFNTLEVRTNEAVMQDMYVGDFVDFCNENHVPNVSFHLPKKVFREASECSKVCDFLMDVKDGTDAVFVTHFYENSENAENYAFAVCKTARDKRLRLAVENVEVKGGNLFFYMDELKKFASSNEIKVCLDIAHLLRSAYLIGISQEAVLDYLARNSWWKENIVEVHLHDFNASRCHVTLGEGFIDFGVVARIIDLLGENVSIILETVIQDLETQGAIEVDYFFRRINLYGNRT